MSSLLGALAVRIFGIGLTGFSIDLWEEIARRLQPIAVEGLAGANVAGGVVEVELKQAK